jgi:two-component system, OmpR family, sensor histidine kinase BaeS
MNRLVTRMVAATIFVVLISMLLIIAPQGFIMSRVFNNLPPDVQARFEEIRQETLHNLSDGDPSAEVQIFHNFDRVRAAFLQSTLLGFVVAGVLSFLLAWRLSRTIAKPIEKVSKAAIEVSKGNLEARANLSERELGARNEMSELGRNFNAMAQALESYESERRAMIADIAHELRTPITALELRLEALSQDLVPFEKSEVERLKKQVTLLSRLVQDLRTLSLADAGQLSLHKQSVDVKQLVQECLKTYELKAKQRDIHLRENLESVAAKLDPERFGQILGNLLDNALRVTPSDGSIDVTLTKTRDTFVLCIADTGPGIPDADLPHIFERFVQARDTKGASTKGSSGLGLAVVQTLVGLHSGTVTAGNRSEGGATFRLELPL